MTKVFTTCWLMLILLLSSFYLQAQEKLQLEDFTKKHTFGSKTVRGVRSMNDGLHFTSMSGDKAIVKYSYKTGEAVDTILNLEAVRETPISRFSGYTFSDSEQRILLTTKVKSIYRHSYTAEYYVWDRLTESISILSEKGAQQVATFSPDGDRVAFVRENNIFMKSLRFETERQVTFDGKFNEVINGIPDWVYEEEFGYNCAFSWSPDSKMLAYVRFDESEVSEMSMPMYQGMAPRQTENKLYPGDYTFKYPKAGEKNSEVSVHVYDIKSKTTQQMDIGEETDIYIPRIQWSPDGMNLAISRLNRRQDRLHILYANPHTGDNRIMLTEKNKRYIAQDFLDNYTYLEDGKHFVVLSERDGWSHLYLYKNNGAFVKQLTKGEFDVTNFYGYDIIKKTFYYQAAKKSPLQREVYALTFDAKKHYIVTPSEGTNSAVFSNGYKYYMNFFSNSKTPLVVTLHDKKMKKLRTLEDNSKLMEKLANYTLPQHEFFSFKTSENIELNGYMIKPSNFDPSKKYPVLMHQYSGPNSQKVADKFSIDWHWYLAEQDYIVVVVDPRGTAARGEEFRKCTYLQLGKYESDDQIEVAKYMRSLDFVDKNNIAMWGWSYGGFMTALTLEKGGDLFAAGISVAPVTNWRFYDSVYTERFMRTPQENADGYDDNSPISNPEGIKANLLLIHGTADDNVHCQNTYEFAEALVQADVQFDMHIYTNRNHGIYGGNTRQHLYTKICKFLEIELKN